MRFLDKIEPSCSKKLHQETTRIHDYCDYDDTCENKGEECEHCIRCYDYEETYDNYSKKEEVEE